MTEKEVLAYKLAEACGQDEGITLTKGELSSVMGDVLVALRAKEVLKDIEAKETEMTSAVRHISADKSTVETVALVQALVGVVEKRNTLRMVLGG